MTSSSKRGMIADAVDQVFGDRPCRAAFVQGLAQRQRTRRSSAGPGCSTEARASGIEMQRVTISSPAMQMPAIAGNPLEREHRDPIPYDVDVREDQPGDQQQSQATGDPSPIVSSRRVAFHTADQVEVGVVAMLCDEVFTGLQQQRIARLQFDLADLRRNSLPVAVHRDDRGVVAPAEVGRLDRRANQRAGTRQDGFDHVPSLIVPQLFDVDRFGGGYEAGNLFEVNNRADHADKDESISLANRRRPVRRE